MSSKKLNTEEAAAFLGVKPCTLGVWRCKKKGPKYSKLGSCVMYDQQELENWFVSRSVQLSRPAPSLVNPKLPLPNCSTFLMLLAYQPINARQAALINNKRYLAFSSLIRNRLEKEKGTYG